MPSSSNASMHLFSETPPLDLKTGILESHANQRRLCGNPWPLSLPTTDILLVRPLSYPSHIYSAQQSPVDTALPPRVCCGAACTSSLHRHEPHPSPTFRLSKIYELDSAQLGTVVHTHSLSFSPSHAPSTSIMARGPRSLRRVQTSRAHRHSSSTKFSSASSSTSHPRFYSSLKNNWGHSKLRLRLQAKAALLRRENADVDKLVIRAVKREMVKMKQVVDRNRRIRKLDSEKKTQDLKEEERAVSPTPSVSVSVSGSSYDADVESAAGSESGHSAASSQRISFLDYFPPSPMRAVYAASAERWFHSAANANGRVRLAKVPMYDSIDDAYDSDGASAGSHDTVDVEADSESTSTSTPAIRLPLPLQRSELSETIANRAVCKSPFLRAAKRSGILNRNNAEVDLAGEAVRFRAEECEWVGLGVTRGMSVRWNNYGRMMEEEEEVDEERLGSVKEESEEEE
ncbi:hypothetical protein C8F01DRAFT_1235853 [Mycena amicta]|nr:hypothetical protein C8F01DRAFT_1235853 [Mycena amicta]